MSFTEDFATQWDYPSALRMVIPSEDRDFHRPRQPHFRSNVMLDDNMAIDNASSSNVKKVQEFFKKSPFGISYKAPIDGVINSDLLNAISEFEENLLVKLNKNIRIREGNQINFNNFNQALKALQEEKDLLASMKRMDAYQSYLDEDTQKNQLSKDSDIDNLELEISEFEKMFNLPATGKITPALIKELQNKEKYTAEILNDNSVIGMIWDPVKQTIKSSAEDVKKTDKLIQMTQQIMNKKR